MTYRFLHNMAPASGENHVHSPDYGIVAGYIPHNVNLFLFRDWDKEAAARLATMHDFAYTDVLPAKVILCN